MWIFYGLMKAKYMLFFIIFSLCKILAATGQTLFSVRFGLNGFFKNLVEEDSCDLLSLIAALATLLVVAVTRVPAMYVLFKPDKTLEKNLSILRLSFSQKSIYYLLVSFNVISGFFSSIGAFLGVTTIAEYMLGKSTVFIEMLAVLVSIACFLSFYSFNIQKAKINSINLIDHFKNNKLFLVVNKVIVKTVLISCLNIFSLPFIAYFLTMNALIKLPIISGCLSMSAIQWIAVFSAVSALISSLTTTLIAMHEFFSQEKCQHVDEASKIAVLRYGTYMAGIVDSGANGLSSFLGVISISQHIIKLAVINHYVLGLAVGCALSSALLNFNFSVRQGFQEVMRIFSKIM